MKLRIAVWLFIFLIGGRILASNEEVLAQLCSVQDYHIFLLSYPRSGNTWLRYCLEYLTGRPTFSRLDFHTKREQPLAWQTQFKVSLEKIPIEKVHRRKEIISFNPNKDKLIFLIRNPKEAILRNENGKITYDILLGNSLRPRGYTATMYFDNIALYDSWNKHNCILIYYEDLLLWPRQVLARLLIFLQEPLTHLDSFIKDYEKHTNACIKIYKESCTGGGDLLFHSRKISSEQRVIIDSWIASLYPHWWDKYLKDYYAEDCLNYK